MLLRILSFLFQYLELTLYDLLSFLCRFLSNKSGYAGAASCIILSNWGSAYGTWKAGTFA